MPMVFFSVIGPSVANRKEWRAVVNRRHVNRKWETVSGMAHVKQRGESMARIRAKNALRPTWPLRSWDRMLHCRRERPR